MEILLGVFIYWVAIQLEKVIINCKNEIIAAIENTLNEREAVEKGSEQSDVR